MVDPAAKRDSTASSEQKETGSFGFLWRIVSLFTDAENPDRKKKRQLKEVAKLLKRQRHKFFKTSSGEALPALARFFYDIYKALAPAHVLVEHADQSAVLKSMVIESFMSAAQQKIQEEMTEEAIRRKAETTDPKQLMAEYKDKLVTFYAAFDSATVKRINRTYDLLEVFLHLIHFDYYFLIKKFDSGLPENDFKYRPHFEPINGDYISDDLKDFLEIVPLLNQKADWQHLLRILEVYKNTPVIADSTWKGTLRSVVEVRDSGVLELMIRYIDEDPDYSVKVVPPSNKIVEDYLSKLKNQTEITIQKILNERRKGKIDKLSQQVFGTAAVSRLRNYTDKANVVFAKKMLGGFTYVTPMNYLKAFLLDYLKSDIKSIVDLLLIRGQWSTNVLSQQLSESFHQLMEIADQLLKFDESVGEDGSRGAVLKSAVYKADRDKGMTKVVKQHLTDINNVAVRIIKESAAQLISLAKYLKSALEDHQSKPAHLILNWRELESAYEGNIDEDITVIYRKIYYFSQLLHHFVK